MCIKALKNKGGKRENTKLFIITLDYCQNNPHEQSRVMSPSWKL